MARRPPRDSGDLAAADRVSAVGPPRPDGFRYPDNWGYRPAAAGLFAFRQAGIGEPESGTACGHSVVVVTFLVAARMTGGVDRERRRAPPGEMAHSLTPIVVGYIFAYYLSYLVERGQQTTFRLADPFVRACNPLGLGKAAAHYILSLHPSVRATIKVAFVVIGHVTAVIAVHDKALPPAAGPSADRAFGHDGRLYLHRPVPAVRRPT